MKLTGKCLEAYSTWSHDKTQEQTPLPIELFEILQNALMIEFFDSVGIYISIINTKDLHQFILEDDFKNYNQRNNNYASRTEATNEAIIKANDLYYGN